MNGPIDPLSRTPSARRALTASRAPDHASADEGEEEVVFVRDEQPERPSPPRRGAFATFAAHVIGQSGQKRGLRGGQEVLDAARSTYLGTEYSGDSDRRPRAGVIRKTEI
jgi:hypothetical protein